MPVSSVKFLSLDIVTEPIIIPLPYALVLELADRHG